MTIKLYYEDASQSSFTSEVLSCIYDEKKKLYAAELEKTCFFPEGGGQYADPGTLDDIPVEDVREKNGIILHYLKKPLEIGKTVSGQIDFEERFSRMQQHSGEHIVSGIAHSRFGCDNVGFHLGNDKTTLDFNVPLTAEDIKFLELEANRVVAADLPVEVLYPTAEELSEIDYRSKIEIEGQIRIVRIPGVDTCACCAPHVSRTGMIGVIKLTDFINYKGGTRITLMAGFRALEDYRRKEDIVRSLSRSLSSKPEDVIASVDRLKQEAASWKEKLVRAQNSSLDKKLKSISGTEKLVTVFEEDLENASALRFADNCMHLISGVCAVFVGSDESGYRYTLSSEHTDLRVFSKEFNSMLSGRGGGKPQLIQGTVNSKEQEIRAFLISFTENLAP